MASEHRRRFPRADRSTPTRKVRASGARVEHKQVALQNALSVLNSGEALDRPDTPDEVVTAVRRLPAVEAAYAPFPADLDPRLRAAFETRGITQLYTHQAEAFAHVMAGRQVVVTTPTASGKTLCYNLPVLDRILKNPATRALYLFPTKALAQDQMAELHELTALKYAIGEVGGEAIGVHTYDGDTPQDARRTIRTRAHIVLSNPDMVHSGILPHHPRWAKLFENLRVRRDRRAARLSRRVRQSPDQRAAPPAAHLPALRLESAVHLLVGDHRQSGGAGGAARGEAVLAGRAGAERREARSFSSSSIRRSSIASLASGARTSPSRAASPASSCAATCK